MGEKEECVFMGFLKIFALEAPEKLVK